MIPSGPHQLATAPWFLVVCFARLAPLASWLCVVALWRWGFVTADAAETCMRRSAFEVGSELPAGLSAEQST